MNEEAIKELAQQLGKGVNWVTDTLLPYVYDYAEYKIAIYTICAILFGIIFILGIIFITKAFKINLAQDIANGVMMKIKYSHC